MTHPSALGRILVLVAVGALLLAACGGDDESTSTSSGGDDADVASSESDGSTEVEDLVDDAGDMLDEMTDTDGGSGTITIGGETWEVGIHPDVPMATCDADFFGGFLGVLTSEGDLTTPLDLLSVTLPGGDFQDPPSVTLKVAVDGDAEWIADETIYERAPTLPEGIGVTEFAIDGNTASGTGTFFEQESFYQFTAGQTDTLQMAEGSFQVTCGS